MNAPGIIVDKFKEIDPVKNRFLGYRFAKPGKACGEMRCFICGRYFNWDITQVEKYILERRWDEDRGEPAHCGKQHCHDYHRRYLIHLHRIENDSEYLEAHTWNLYQRLQSQGML